MEKIVGVVPARLKSSRLAEKPLLDICGMPMVVHVALRASLVNQLTQVVVATDSSLIMDVCDRYGIHSIRTADSHRNPSERMCELLDKLTADYFVLVNGDEPLVRPVDILTSIETCRNSTADASLLSVPTAKFNSPSDFKIVKDSDGRLLYITRADIPHGKTERPPNMEKAYHIMTFRADTLAWYKTLAKTTYESYEDHEHLRLIEAGGNIKVQPVDHECFSVDTAEDLEWVRLRMPSDETFQLYKHRAQ